VVPEADAHARVTPEATLGSCSEPGPGRAGEATTREARIRSVPRPAGKSALTSGKSALTAGKPLGPASKPVGSAGKSVRPSGKSSGPGGKSTLAAGKLAGPGCKPATEAACAGGTAVERMSLSAAATMLLARLGRSSGHQSKAKPSCKPGPKNRPGNLVLGFSAHRGRLHVRQLLNAIERHLNGSFVPLVSRKVTAGISGARNGLGRAGERDAKPILILHFRPVGSG
jgi:hypothetical protein